jgi:hypothetical protein
MEIIIEGEKYKVNNNEYNKIRTDKTLKYIALLPF